MSTNSPFVGFDIECRPVYNKVERFNRPFPAFVPPPAFDEAAVKLGNLKDPAARAEKIANARVAAEIEAVGAVGVYESKKAAYWEELKSRAALNPFTGEIVVIGLIDENARVAYLEGTESEILEAFWGHFTNHGYADKKFLSWSGSGSPSKSFDIDYIVTRSRILGVRVPGIARRGRFYSERIVDLASEFLLYQNDAYLKLTAAADILGLYDEPSEVAPLTPKRDDDVVTGETFWMFWDEASPLASSVVGMTAAERREVARTYLRNDLFHLFRIAERIL